MIRKTFHPNDLAKISSSALPVLNHINLLDHVMSPDEYDGKKFQQIICTLPQVGERAVTLTPEECLLEHGDTDGDFVLARVSSHHDVAPDLWMVTKVSTYQAYLLPIGILDEYGHLADNAVHL